MQLETVVARDLRTSIHVRIVNDVMIILVMTGIARASLLLL